MENPITKFRQSSTITETSGYLSEKLKTLTSSNYRSICFADILRTSPTLQCLQKVLRDFFHLSAIWLPHSQLWFTIKGATSLTCINHCVFDTNFDTAVEKWGLNREPSESECKALTHKVTLSILLESW